MKKTILRILIRAILLALISGIVVAIIGLKLGWKTPTQFSDGFFWAGAILISIGMVNILGMFSQGTVSEPMYSQSPVDSDPAERYKILEGDVTHGYHLVAFLGTSGLLLFGLAGLAILVGRLF